MRLFKYKWLIPVVALLYKQRGSRVVSLYKELGMSRSMLSSTLGRLKNYGLIIDNPGHGHPLRPEIILTPLGTRLAPFCVDFMDLIQNKNMSPLFQNRWAVPIIFKTGDDKLHFSEYKKELAPITSKALSEGLNFLVSRKILTKKIILKGKVEITYELPKKFRQLCGPFYEYQKFVEGQL